MRNQAFLSTFDKVTVTIPFNPKWKNGYGYFSFAVDGEDMPSIPTGLTVKCVDDTGRKMIITSITGKAEDGEMNGKQVSCVVFFEYFAHMTDIHSNATKSMRLKYDFLDNGRISCEDFRKFH